MKKLFISIMLIATVALVGCTRIATGEAGVRINMNNVTEATALHEGTWNQTLFGSVLEFPVREVALTLSNRHPLTSENVPLGEMDVVLTYNLHPDVVPELWSKRSKQFHIYHEDTKEYHLMEGYLTTIADNALLKTVRKYQQLQVNDNRQQIEQEIMGAVRDDLKVEGLDNVVSFSKIQVKQMIPNASILDSAKQIVTTQNQLKTKQNEVLIAEQEAKRMTALANQGAQAISFMQAQAMLNISEGVKSGKVSTIVIPADFRGLMSIGGK